MESYRTYTLKKRYKEGAEVEIDLCSKCNMDLGYPYEGRFCKWCGTKMEGGVNCNAED